MIVYLAMRVIYGIYVVVGALIIYRSLSQMIFHPEFRRPGFFFKRVGLAIIWPLGLLSKNGRKSLASSLPFLGRAQKGE